MFRIFAALLFRTLRFQKTIFVLAWTTFVSLSGHCVAIAATFDIPGIGKFDIPIPGLPSTKSKLLTSPTTETPVRQETLPAVKPARSEVRSAPVETVTKPAYAVVVQCTGVFDIGDLVQMNLGSDPRTKLFITPTRGDRVRLWNLIIELSPATKGLSSEQAINTMTQIRDNYIRTNLARYEADIDVLVADYRRCQDLGLIPRQ